MRIKKANTFQWDANGNMTKQGSNIYLQWDEENRLKSVSKPAQGVCFFYDASGKRFYKNSGQKQMMLVNGSYYMNIPFYDSPVLYTSPYVVVTRDGYTKHYFVEAERFASRIGDGSISGINSHAASSAALAAKQADVDFYAPDSIRPDNFTFLRSMPNHLSARHTTYWQHSDHLGSASWVTDTNGLGYQHFQYRAWGEPFIEQNSTANGYETRYTFSGKERDEETGYSYFGARHYNSTLSIWLSVDPLADKYPGTSPYTYCASNPVRLVDPDGMWIPGLDDENNVIVTMEENDDLNSFKQFMGPAYSDEEIQNIYAKMQDGEINLTEAYGGVFQLITDAINESYDNPNFETTEEGNYNCYGAAIALTSGRKLQGNGVFDKYSVGINQPDAFDSRLRRWYNQVDPDNASVGVTVLRFGKSSKSSHGAVYMGKDKSGNEYAFTKNGWHKRPTISQTSSIINEYGSNCSMGSYFDQVGMIYTGKGYYNHKPPKQRRKRH